MVIFAELIEHLAINPDVDARRDPSGAQAGRPSHRHDAERALDRAGRQPCSPGGDPSSTTTAPRSATAPATTASTPRTSCTRCSRRPASTSRRSIARDLGTVRACRSDSGAPPCALLLRLFSPTSRRAHLFLRARRRPVFRWRFPQVLFTEPNVYRYVRHPWVEMGVNDTIQCEVGWDPLEQLPDGSGRVACSAWTLPCPVDRRCCAAPPA